MWFQFKNDYPEDGAIRWKIWKMILNRFIYSYEPGENENIYDLEPWGQEEDDDGHFIFRNDKYELQLVLNLPCTMIVSAMKLNMIVELEEDEYGLPLPYPNYPRNRELPNEIKTLMSIFNFKREGIFMVLQRPNVFDSNIKTNKTRVANFPEMAYHLIKSGWDLV